MIAATATFAPDQVYRAREVHERGHLPRAMVYEALEAGDLQAVRRGRSWLIPGAAVIRWIESLGGEAPGS